MSKADETGAVPRDAEAFAAGMEAAACGCPPISNLRGRRLLRAFSSGYVEALRARVALAERQP